jgi:hypothetical protein
LSLNDDHGDAAEAGSAGPPCSGKPEGLHSKLESIPDRAIFLHAVDAYQ